MKATLPKTVPPAMKKNMKGKKKANKGEVDQLKPKGKAKKEDEDEEDEEADRAAQEELARQQQELEEQLKAIEEQHRREMLDARNQEEDGNARRP